MGRLWNEGEPPCLLLFITPTPLLSRVVRVPAKTLVRSGDYFSLGERRNTWEGVLLLCGPGGVRLETATGGKRRLGSPVDLPWGILFSTPLLLEHLWGILLWGQFQGGKVTLSLARCAQLLGAWSLCLSEITFFLTWKITLSPDNVQT